MPESLHDLVAATRQLRNHERRAIALALELLMVTPPSDMLDELRALFLGDVGLPSSDELHALALECLTATGVQLCSSRRRAC